MRKIFQPVRALIALLTLPAFLGGCASVKPRPKVCFGIIGRCVEKGEAIGMQRPRSKDNCLASCIRYGVLTAERVMRNTFSSEDKGRVQ